MTEGVDVEVFDWDNYKQEDDEHKIGVPTHFADIAKIAGVPVIRDADEVVKK